MNSLTRWKIVLMLIAIFVAGALTGGFVTSRAIKDAIRQSQEQRESFILTMDRLQNELHLNPEQANKIRPILTQMENELNNLHSLDVRETDGIFSRARGRMDPIVASDQRSRLQEILEKQRRCFEETPSIINRPR